MVLQVVAAGHERGFDGVVRAGLPQADVGHQSIAEASAPLRVLRLAALLHVGIDRLGGASIADLPLGCVVRNPERAEIAKPLPLHVAARRTGPGHHLEGKSGGRRPRVGRDRHVDPARRGPAPRTSVRRRAPTRRSRRRGSRPGCRWPRPRAPPAGSPAGRCPLPARRAGRARPPSRDPPRPARRRAARRVR